MPHSLELETLDDVKKVQLINNRWESAAGVWAEIEKAYKKNLKFWKNSNDLVNQIPAAKSRVRDNRIFIAEEALINNLTGRPSKPNVIPVIDTPEAQEIADALQDAFLAYYRDLKIKSSVRRALRYLFLSRLFVIKGFWNHDIDLFDFRPVDPLKVRFSPRATNARETEFAIEEITKSVLDVIALFPDKEEVILTAHGWSKEFAAVNNPDVTYREAWLDWGRYVCYECRGSILKEEKNPFWNWEGIAVTDEEYGKLKNKYGKGRRGSLRDIKGNQNFRSQEIEQRKAAGQESYYQQYLYNFHDRPMPPYIFGSVFLVEEKPIGETSLFEMAIPLQEGVDERKRSIADNARLVNGIWKIDTLHAKVSKDAAYKFRADIVGGVLHGDGVREGVTRETGAPLPAFVFQDLAHSIAEIDNLFGTQPTFRGDRGQAETATGRAILREQSFARMDEMIDLVDTMHLEIYAWMMQFIKSKFTESHFIKPLGSVTASQTIDLMQDDLNEGLEIGVIPGQILPEDRFYKAERATEEAKAGLMTPRQYFERTGADNPDQRAKELELYKLNPLTAVNLTPEDIERLRQAQAIMSPPQAAPAAPVAPAGPDVEGQKAEAISQLRERAQQLFASKQFQELPPERQAAVSQAIRERLESVAAA